MLSFIAKRLLIMIPTLFVISIITFILIQLPEGDFVSSWVAREEGYGRHIDLITQQAMREQYGLDRPLYEQYTLWMWDILHGNFGYSFELSKPVNEVIWERLALTFAVSFSSLLFSWLIAFPIGFYSAVKQYSVADYVFTFLGFFGLAVPGFLMALVLMWVSFKYFGLNVGGLFSSQFIDAPWDMAKLVDLLQHLWIPTIIIGMEGSAGLIRVMRNNLLDELQKPYVVAARARGLTELQLLLKYPVRVAINPFIATVGWLLPRLISGATIVSMVLNLPTTGPVQLDALRRQDMYLGASFTMMLAALTVLGTLVSDILLAVVDPRVRFE